jgi:hypothetical protein
LHKSQKLSPAIRYIRSLAIAGTRPSQILAFVSSQRDVRGLEAFMHLGDVFLVGSLFAYTFGGFPFTEEDERVWQGFIDQKRSVWEKEKLPDLMRFRDYFSFMQFARDEQVIVVVRGADPASGRWIGKPGVRCYGGRLPILTSQSAPNDGLLAADPTDPRLVAMLGQFDPPISYADYVQRLGAQGLQVSPAHEAFLVKDGLGNRFHDNYRLLGVYDDGDAPAWIHPRAERLRAALNRHLGSDLVHFGPHDEWQFRNDKKVAGPLWGPQPPAIEFSPDQEIRNLLTVDDLTRRFRYRNQARWNEMYPHHPIEIES